VFQSRIGHLRAAEVQVLQRCETVDLCEVRVGHSRSRETNGANVREAVHAEPIDEPYGPVEGTVVALGLEVVIDKRTGLSQFRDRLPLLASAVQPPAEPNGNDCREKQYGPQTKLEEPPPTAFTLW